jgi:zinc protease
MINVNRLIRSVTVLTLVAVSSIVAFAQYPQPSPGEPKTGQIPLVRDKKLPNGLTVAVGQRRSIPLVTILLLVKSAAAEEDLPHAGLANLTGSLLVKGTKTRTATQIAEQIEFLGGSINSGAGWNNSVVSVTVTSDKVDQAIAILSDVALNPAFKQEELDLLKSQTLDGLTYNLKQPGFLASYVSSRYTYGEHPAGGTPASLEAIKRDDVTAFHKQHYTPDNSVLIFTGDITDAKANALAQKYFGKWRPGPKRVASGLTLAATGSSDSSMPRRILVVDLPNSGQAAVRYSRKVDAGRVTCTPGGSCSISNTYFPATLMDSVLGGGYSSRLNLEIRIKRGLSYGAGTGLGWRDHQANFSASAQTKPESAAQVAELVMDEIRKLGDKGATSAELGARRLVLSGDFGRDLETTGGMANRISDLYSFGLSPIEMNAYIRNVRSVNDGQIRDFASRYTRGGDIVIVGDSKLFMDDLRRRFPGMLINTIAAADLDLTKESLQR